MPTLTGPGFVAGNMVGEASPRLRRRERAGHPWDRCNGSRQEVHEAWCSRSERTGRKAGPTCCGCSSRTLRTTPSSCSTRRATSSPGTPGPSASRATGQRRSSASTSPSFYPQADIDRGWPAHELKVATAEGRFEDEGWRIRKDGSRFWANVVITALRDERGEACGGSPKITRDLTERKQAEESLAGARSGSGYMVEGVKDYAIFMLDPQGNVATWNAGAERIKQYKAEEIIGQHFSRFYPQEDIDRGWPAHELKVAAAEGRFEDEGWRVRKDGSQFWANVVITAIGRGRGAARLHESHP